MATRKTSTAWKPSEPQQVLSKKPRSLVYYFINSVLSVKWSNSDSVTQCWCPSWASMALAPTQYIRICVFIRKLQCIDL